PACAETLELRHFNFAQIRHYNFALTTKISIIRIMSIDVSMVIVHSGLRSPQDSNIAVRDQHPIVFVQIRICKTRCALIEPIQPIRKIPQPATT
ncbi:hypothetical protein, partial [Burkholderia cenocepacia]